MNDSYFDADTSRDLRELRLSQEKMMKTLNSFLSEMKTMITGTNISMERVTTRIDNLCERVSVLEKKVTMLTATSSATSMRILNSMIRRHDPLPFSISACVQSQASEPNPP